MGLFKIFSTVDKNEKSQDKHIVGYFSVVVLDGASALGKMEAWNPQMFQSLQKEQMIHHVIQEGLLYIWILQPLNKCYWHLLKSAMSHVFV